jgi:hypothetical protein
LPVWVLPTVLGCALLLVFGVTLYLLDGSTPRAERVRHQEERVSRMEVKLRDMEPVVERDERIRQGFGVKGESPVRQNYEAQAAQYERERTRLSDLENSSDSGSLKKVLIAILVVVVAGLIGFMRGGRK